MASICNNSYVKTIYGFTYKLVCNTDTLNFSITLPNGNCNSTIIDKDFCIKYNTSISELYQVISAHIDNYSYAVYYNDYRKLIFETWIHKTPRRLF